MNYKILGFLVWNGAKWYLRLRVARTRRLAAAGAVGLGAGVLLAAGATARNKRRG